MEIKIKDNIDRILEERNWTIYRLGKESGVSVSLLYGLSDKKRSLNVENLVKVADALNLTVDEIVRGGKQ